MNVQRFFPALPCGSSLRISNLQDINPLAVGGTVWPAASAMALHLLQHRAAVQQTKGILELGSGTGALGLFAAGLGGRCTLTEHKPPRSAIEPVSYNCEGELELLSGNSDTLLDLLSANVDSNAHLCAHPPKVMELDWASHEQVRTVREAAPSGGFPMVIGSDLTYNTSMLQPLADTVADLLCRGGGVALIGHQPRMYSLSGKDAQLNEFRLATDAAGLILNVSDLPHLDANHNPNGLSQGKLLQLSHAN